MALHRGIQSAIFYYLACTPCADVRYRKKLKKQAERDRADKAMLEAQMPNLYRHPSPSSTNPYWQAEIAMGPSGPVRGKRKTTPTTAGPEGTAGQRPKPSAMQSSVGSQVASSVDVARVGSPPEERIASTISLRQQQRRDEELWGSEATDPPLKSFLDGPTATPIPGVARPPKARTRDSSSYQSSVNPSLNDLHPATTRRVASREDIAWMLQPQPVAAVMEGREQPSASRSVSYASSGPSLRSAPVSRESSSRLKATRMPSAESAVSSSSSLEPVPTLADGPSGQRHNRSSAGLSIAERDFAVSPSKRERQKPTPIQVMKESEDSGITVVRHPSLAPERPSRGIASRPQLSTIMSDSVVPDDPNSFYTPQQTPKENRFPSSDESSNERDKTSRRTAVLVNDSSLKALQDLTPKVPIFNTKIFTTSPAGMEAKIRLPAQDGEEERRLSGGPEVFDSWYTPDFELGEWVHEHTKREGIRHRWSMDV